MKKRILLLLVIFPGWALAADGLEKVSSELADGIRRVGLTRVVVLAPVYSDSRPSDGPATVSQKLTTYLSAQKSITVIERDQMIQLLNELHLSETGLLDPKSAKRIGEMLKADVIVTGTLIDLGNRKTELNARALLAQNGRVIAASRTIMDCTWSKKPTLGWDAP